MPEHISYNMDFKKAYDSVRREVLCNILNEFGVKYETSKATYMGL
jgi:hypothetical protein